MNSGYISHTLANKNIRQRISDGYFSANDICFYNNKNFDDWYNLDTTKELIVILDNEVNDGKKIKSIKIEKYGSTYISWIHPDLAVPLAYWISPLLSMYVFRWSYEIVIMNNAIADKQRQLTELKKKIQISENKNIRLNKILQNILNNGKNYP